MNSSPKLHLHPNLPRLGRESYRGAAVIFWTHSIQARATGWLNDRFHQAFRETLLHACVRYSLACPVYTLMPDHFHLVGLGLKSASDQWIATAFLRKHLKRHLRPALLQDRAYDHILRRTERDRRAFMSICHYIRENPVRAHLCEAPSDWKFAGAMVPGYPDMDPSAESFWDDFWKIHNKLACTQPSQNPPCSPLQKERHPTIPVLPHRATFRS